jgi:hypothetical protein
MFAFKKGASMRPHVGPFYYHADGKLTLFPPARARKPTKGASDGAAAKPQGAGAKPQGAGAKPQGAGAKPKGAGAKPKGAAAKPQGAAAKPKGAAAKPKGVSSKTVEAMSDQEFREYVRANWNSWVKVVSGDGSCQFHAFLNKTGKSDIDQQHAYDLRMEVVSWVTKNPDKSTDDFIEKIIPTGQTVRQQAIDKHGLKGDDWKKEYKRLMLKRDRKGGLGYATDLELGVAALIHNVDVYLFERSANLRNAPTLLQYLPFGHGKGSKRFSLLYNRARNYKKGQHYDRYNLPEAVLDRLIKDTKKRNLKTKEDVQPEKQ